jgi:hypothetical protein
LLPQAPGRFVDAGRRRIYSLRRTGTPDFNNAAASALTLEDRRRADNGSRIAFAPSRQAAAALIRHAPPLIVL